MKKMLFTAAGLLLYAGLAAQNTPQPFMVGNYEVYVLVEGSGPADTEILIDAPQSVLDKYAPEGTFPIATNTVLIKGPEGVHLVDTGYGVEIFDNMERLGVSSEDITCIMLTHMHGDHIGGMIRNGEKSFPNAVVMVSEAEYNYWSSTEELNKAPEDHRNSFARALNVFDKYEDTLLTGVPYTTGEEAEKEDNTCAIEAYGHTPGHIMFLIQDGGESLLIWGDLTHALAVQMPHPEISVTYDIDPDIARTSRLAVLDWIAADEGTDPAEMIPVIGMHIPATYPGVVYRNGDGYRFEVLPASGE